VLADLAFKIIMTNDEVALRKIMQIDTNFIDLKDGAFRTQSSWSSPLFTNKEEAIKDYDEILNIILAYQDRIPTFVWRNKE
jgi:hypothetical protein